MSAALAVRLAGANEGCSSPPSSLVVTSVGAGRGADSPRASASSVAAGDSCGATSPTVWRHSFPIPTTASPIRCAGEPSLRYTDPPPGLVPHDAMAARTGRLTTSTRAPLLVLYPRGAFWPHFFLGKRHETVMHDALMTLCFSLTLGVGV
jgi:hypothetical protein